MSHANYEVLNEELNLDNVAVSIYCLAYNHKNYISTALDSFLMQKTNFNFRIIVHDDASTDGTADILREYASKYPEKLVVILQKENQYSKGTRIISEYIIPRCKGKYVAVCEGDDYWIDDQKLQKQYDYMESHPNCYLCAHSGLSVDAETKKPLGKTIYSKDVCEVSIEDAIAGFGRIVLTNSFFQRIECCRENPYFRTISPCGDYIMPIIAALQGTVAYIPDIMSAYRLTSNKDSVTAKMRTNHSFRRGYTEKYDAMLSALDEHTESKYSNIIEVERDRIWMNYYVQIGDRKTLRQEPYKSIVKGYSSRQKIIFYGELYLPRMIARLRYKSKIKRLVKTSDTIELGTPRTNQWLKV